jgi:hypothetical protein
MTQRSPGTALSWLTRVGAAAGLFFMWTIIETQFIEPFGLYVFLPFYRVNGICTWDVFAIAGIVAAFALAGRREVQAR